MTRPFRGHRPAAAVEAADNRLRTLLTQRIAVTGAEPSMEGLASLAGASTGTVRGALKRLQARRGLLLHPHARRPWVVHPFSLFPSQCWVQGRVRGWWATCLWCAFGIAGCVGEDVVISARYGAEAEGAVYRVVDGALAPSADLFHFGTPARRWWDNVLYACASFQPFRAEADIESWCARHSVARGYVIPVERLFAFALDWYGRHAVDWRPWTAAETRACFARHGLNGPFWTI